jgi:hypothetical protein
MQGLKMMATLRTHLLIEYFKTISSFAGTIVFNDTSIFKNALRPIKKLLFEPDHQQS